MPLSVWGVRWVSVFKIWGQTLPFTYHKFNSKANLPARGGGWERGCRQVSDSPTCSCLQRVSIRVRPGNAKNGGRLAQAGTDPVMQKQHVFLRAS